MAAEIDQDEVLQSQAEIKRSVNSYVRQDKELQQAWEDIISEQMKQFQIADVPPIVGIDNEDDEDGPISFELWLRENDHGQVVYPALLQLCDCSYTESYDFFNTTKWKSPKIKNWVNTVRDDQTLNLIESGFTKPNHACESKNPDTPARPYIVVQGFTGANNQTEDMTCIVSERVKLDMEPPSHVIVVAFHGSTSKTHWSKLIRMFSFGWLGKHDDWESNATFTGKPASDLGIDKKVLFHGGYLMNYRSVHDKLIDILRKLLRAHTEISMENKWVIFTGHSKGGGMATVGGCIATHTLKQMYSDEVNNVNFGIFAVSSPRVFKGDASRDWAQDTMGFMRLGASKNIVRINVEGDIVPLLPLKSWGFGSYRHVGYSHTEKREILIDRMAQLHPTFQRARWWNFIGKIKVQELLHYAHGFTEKFGNFDSRIVIDLSKWSKEETYVLIADDDDNNQFNPYVTF